jgi:hypothetical protein
MPSFSASQVEENELAKLQCHADYIVTVPEYHFYEVIFSMPSPDYAPRTKTQEMIIYYSKTLYLQVETVYLNNRCQHMLLRKRCLGCLAGDLLNSCVTRLPDLWLEVQVHQLSLLRSPLSVGVPIVHDLVAPCISDLDCCVGEEAL